MDKSIFIVNSIIYKLHLNKQFFETILPVLIKIVFANKNQLKNKNFLWIVTKTTCINLLMKIVYVHDIFVFIEMYILLKVLQLCTNYIFEIFHCIYSYFIWQSYDFIYLLSIRLTIQAITLIYLNCQYNILLLPFISSNISIDF